MSRLCGLLCCIFLGIIPMLLAQSCEPNHQLCSPAGGTSNRSPVDWSSNGTLLADFYENLVDSVNDQSSKRSQPTEGLHSRASSAKLCCTSGTKCLLLQKFFVPFCWDTFTTDYFLPDNSYGNVASGNYTLISGEINLITGDYTKLPNQVTGNMYSPGEFPNTSTLPMPAPWTSKGVGTAIPASEVGEASNITDSSSAATRTINLPSNSISPTTSSGFASAPQRSTPTVSSVAGSTTGGLSSVLIPILIMALL